LKKEFYGKSSQQSFIVNLFRTILPHDRYVDEGKKNFSFKWMDILLTMEPVAPDQCPNPSLSIKEIDFSHLFCIFLFFNGFNGCE